MCKELLRGERVIETGDLDKWRGRESEKGQRARLVSEVYATRACEDAELCASVGPVRCYFTGSNCRRKHGKHRQVSRVWLCRYGAHFSRTFPKFYFIRVHIIDDV